MKSNAWLPLSLTLALVACGDAPTAEEDYRNFESRADRTPIGVQEIRFEGELRDITGNYKLNIDLGGAGLGDVSLELQLSLTNFRLNEAGDGALVDGAFRYPDETDSDPALVEFLDQEIDSVGRLLLDLGEVRIEPERSPIENTAVEVLLRLTTLILPIGENGEDWLCGVVDDPESEVRQPLKAALAGVTFGGVRYGEGNVEPTDVPKQCPAEYIGDGEEEEEEDLDAGVDEDAGDIELPIPTGELPEGGPADITGRHWMKVAVGGSGAIALDFIADVVYREGADSAWLDGALRYYYRGEEAATVMGDFSVPVAEDGTFMIEVRGLEAASSLGDVVADVILSGVIIDENTWCGFADGQALLGGPGGSPLALTNTTYGVARMPEVFPAPPYEYGPDFTDEFLGFAITRCPAE